MCTDEQLSDEGNTCKATIATPVRTADESQKEQNSKLPPPEWLPNFPEVLKPRTRKNQTRKDIFFKGRCPLPLLSPGILKKITSPNQRRTKMDSLQYPAGFEMSGRTAKDLSGTAPVSARRFLHTRRVPAGPIQPDFSAKMPSVDPKDLDSGA